MKRIKALFRKIYFTEGTMTEKDYERGRKLFIIEGSGAVIINNLTIGAFLTGFAKFMGASESFCGLLLTVPTFTSIIQLFSPLIIEKMEYRKFIVAIFAPLHRLMLGMMIFIPFIFKDTVTRLGVLFIFYTTSHLILQFTNAAAVNWIMSLVPEDFRGRYFGNRDSLMLAINTVFTLSLGMMLDYFENVNMEVGFVILYSVIGILAISNFILLGSIKEPKVSLRYYKDAYTGEIVPAGVNLKQIVLVPLLNTKFRKIIWIFIIYNIAIMVALPYFAVYQVTVLKIKYTVITFNSMLQTLTMIFFARIWGRLADSKGWFLTARSSFLLLAGVHVFWFFVNESFPIFIISILHIFGGVCWSGINMSMFNIPYKFSPDKAKTVYLSFNSALAGVISLITSIASSRFVAFMGDKKINILGIGFSSMQITFIVSGIGLVVLGLFVLFRFERNKEFMNL